MRFTDGTPHRGLFLSDNNAFHAKGAWSYALFLWQKPCPANQKGKNMGQITESSRQIQFRRGTSAQNNNFTGAVGEITVDTENRTLRVHDGETPGGTPLARADQTGGALPDNYDFVVETSTTTTSWYRKYKSGWVEQGGYIAFDAVAAGGQSDVVVNFPVPLRSSPACRMVCLGGSFTGTNNANVTTFSSTSTKTTVRLFANSAISAGLNVLWEVRGISAS